MKQLIYLFQLFRPFWGWALLGVLLSMATMLANIALLATSAWFITAMGVAGLAGASINYFTPAAIIRGCAIFRTVGRYVERLVTHEATFRFLGALRLRTFKNYTQIPLEQVERLHSTDLTSRVQYDIESLQGFYVRVLVPLCASFFTALICVLYLLKYDITIVLPVVSGLVIAGALLPVLAFRAVLKNANDIFVSAETLKKKSIDLLDGLGELMVYNNLAKAQQDFRDHSADRLKILKSVETVGLLTKNAIWLISQLTFIATVLLAADLLQARQLTQADFVMVSMFALACFESIAQVAPALMQIPQNKAAAERIFFVNPDTQNQTEEPEQNPGYPDLALKQVEYRFNDFQIYPVKFDFELPAGQTLLIKGPSGIGKSTLIDLLVGDRFVQKGEISLNGQTIKNMTEQQLVATFSISPQHTHIFSGSFLNNLNLGCDTCNLDDVNEVLEMCQLKSLLESLPDRLSTYIGEQGYNLSGGQIRRLGVARALLKKAPVLILDEPTEGLDYETGKYMMEQIMAKRNGRSLIVISHQDMDYLTFDQIKMLN
ncbi:MAG: thiol reductant ABC exporter subunit CydC [Methylocystaceae bacterium]|nr:thiol reductant ABC exporter subunit CydC [Methylocystaceae bacterium]